MRAQLDTSTVTGEVRERFTDSSSQLVICPTTRRPCANLEDLSILSVGSIRSLLVRGKQQGVFALLGFYVGALAEAGITRRADVGMVLGGFGGGALGALIGSKKVGWMPLFPCAHACAAGHYPQPGIR